ncbi:membrane transporter [Coprinopsis cinerea okayama7|uniref:Membrane transporter n=1 Tax=Coprinopsis cinerea (strain Okayama-7 / 130 / ATCC MYA-4618 / FGSC 9003) TaxID=240176 RepID=D6RQ22_COPC7|nr:membrane transporter [Coprinopsis cinerea okayama7\|eukprot:XP_002910436.1 membrane transporter [Coprinopsis cinerea okayama7\
MSTMKTEKILETSIETVPPPDNETIPEKYPSPLSVNLERGELSKDGASVYEQKLAVLNNAMQSIGFGKYHRRLFIVAGFGWFIDSATLLLAGLLIPPLLEEFHVNGAYFVITIFTGLLVGSLVWGVIADMYGRVWPFNLTLLISGVFSLAAGGANNFTTLAVLVGMVGFGTGGNVPIDSAIFMEFMPSSHSHLTTALQTFWVLGNIAITLVAWPLIGNYSCDSNDSGECRKADNMGWRYLMFTIGGTTLCLGLLRMCVFRMHESPRYLLGRGREGQAVDIVNRIATFNRVPIPLSLHGLEAMEQDGHQKSHAEPKPGILSQEAKLALRRVKTLFMPFRMGVSSVLLILLWTMVGLATTLYINFLPYLLATRGDAFGDASISVVYRNQVLIALCGIFSPYVASKAAETKLLGRRGTMAITCIASGVLLLGSTTSRSSNALLGWNCGFSLWNHAMYGLLISFTSEVFPTSSRGTGMAIVSTVLRISGVLSPLIALKVDAKTPTPAYIGGGLLVVAGIIPLLVPYEPRGRQSR